jgi:hypothetical protein
VGVAPFGDFQIDKKETASGEVPKEFVTAKQHFRAS